MYCPKCGAPNKAASRFCVKCGRELPDNQGISASAEGTYAAAASEAGSRKVVMHNKRSGKRKTVVIALFVMLALAAAMIMVRKKGIGARCEACEEIAGLQEQLKAKLDENKDRTLKENDYTLWMNQVDALSGEIMSLCDHDCKMPVKTVKDQFFVYNRYVGTYSGDWQSVMPKGNGTFTGSYIDGETFSFNYSGNWDAGKPNGTGMISKCRRYANEVEEHYFAESYDGEISDGEAEGSGVYTTENTDGQRFEYYDARYEHGKMVGQANYLEYVDGQLYDRGIAEGSTQIPVYSERAALTAAAENAAFIAGIAITGGMIIDYFQSGNAEIESYLENVRAENQADLNQYRTNQQLAEQRKQEAQRYKEQADYSYSKWQEAQNSGDDYDAGLFESDFNYFSGLAGEQ